jgi:hypothetical protein
MATTKLDQLAVNFLKRIPDEFLTSFTPGSAMPDSNILTKEQIISYLNQAMLRLFNDKWNEAVIMAKGRPERSIQIIANMLPELVKYSNVVSGVTYFLDDPYLDLFKIVGIVGKNNEFVRIWDESKYLLAITGEYDEYVATSTNPAAIFANRIVTTFPQDLVDWTFRMQYIALPLDPETGTYFLQNGTYDCPFGEQWFDMIVEMAYDIYLYEAQETR